MAVWLQAFLHTEGRTPVPKRVEKQALFEPEWIASSRGTYAYQPGLDIRVLECAAMEMGVFREHCS